MSTLLRDIFTIPDHSEDSDYVLKLVESVDDDHLAATLSSYIVTPDLARAFDKALGLVSDAIKDNTSRGAFLTGSFGSGKSHFMAVLYALLQQNPQARAITGLTETTAKHDPALQQRHILPLTIHMLDAKSMEQAIFDAYLRQLKQQHPDMTPPVLHQSGKLLDDADSMRARLGDDAFFDLLNDSDEGSSADDPWGSLLGDANRWQATSYASARAAAPGDPHRAELVNALTNRIYRNFAGANEYLSLDEGLTAISRHAKSLGYDAVVLFLDELVLWLAFQVRDVQFFGRETQKLSKLVEGGQGGRQIPFISFIARQVDLRRWLADSGASGQEQAALEQGFEFQSGRFPSIKLGDDNLPYVAHQRLLTPKSPAAQAEIDHAFDALDRRSDAWDVLLDGSNTDEQHRSADAEQFRLTYPFSPALVSTLRSLAAVMQRERTALKVMQELLVTQRNTLTIDDVIPVGDAFDLLITGGSGQQPLDEASAALFRAADSLYRERLHPVILKINNVTEDDLAADRATPAVNADLRLAKTLLLSAVAPNVPALKGLTASRLAALNHGSIRSPLPGGEVSTVLAKVRSWAGQIPEIRVEPESRNPLISVQLSDVDYESVVDRARIEDNEGRRIELIQRLIADELGISLGQQDALGAYLHPITWRGSRREIDLVFGNVRDASWLTDEHFRARPGTWRFVIDRPYDEAGHSPTEDLNRIEALKAQNWDERTIVWLPRFFSEDRMKDISRLVILNFLLDGSGKRYDNYADHLSPTGRLQAKAMLQSQREALLITMKRAVQVAYDVESPMRSDDVISGGNDVDVLISLTPSFAPHPPAGGTLRIGFEKLAEVAFAATYPAHPEFDPGSEEIRVRDLKAVYGYVERGLADPEHRIPLGGDAASIRRIANPLAVGRAAETHYLIGDDYFAKWGPEFERRLGSRDDAQGPLTVGEIRGWIQQMQPANGLAIAVSDLVILTWAALRRRAWFRSGASIPVPDPGQLKDDMELREQPMPSAETWSKAIKIAGSVFAIPSPSYLTPAAVATLAESVSAAVKDRSESANKLVTAITSANRHIGIAQQTERLSTAKAVVKLLDGLRGLRGLRIVDRLAAAETDDPTTAGRSLASASSVTSQLNAHKWDRYLSVQDAAGGEGPRADQAAIILASLREGLSADEMATAITTVLSRAEDATFRWLAEGQSESPATEPPAQKTRPRSSGKVRLQPGADLTQTVTQLTSFAAENNDAAIVIEWHTE